MLELLHVYISKKIELDEVVKTTEARMGEIEERFKLAQQDI